MRIDAFEIVRHYRKVKKIAKAPLPQTLGALTLSNTATGIGDTVILTDLPRAAAENDDQVTVFSMSHFFKTLMSFNPHYLPGVTPFLVASDLLVATYDLGNGHYIQRLRRAFGYPVDDLPRGCLVVPDTRPTPKRVALHFEAGAHSLWQRQHVHPQARILSRESKAAIQQFIARHGDWEFVEFGKTSQAWDGVLDRTGIPFADAIRELAQCEYFLGILSGPLHIAAALGLKIITIVNFPPADQIYLPTLVDSGQVEGEWFYPQSVLLHQEGEGPLVPMLTVKNLECAFQGEIYPYWSEDYLSLIHEPL